MAAGDGEPHARCTRRSSSFSVGCHRVRAVGGRHDQRDPAEVDSERRLPFHVGDQRQVPHRSGDDQLLGIHVGVPAKLDGRFVDEIAWVKCNRNRRMAKSHGFYLQHSKETCFVAKRGNPPPLTNFGLESDVIYSERLGQSQKPTDIYELIERLVPNGGGVGG